MYSAKDVDTQTVPAPSNGEFVNIAYTLTPPESRQCGESVCGLWRRLAPGGDQIPWQNDSDSAR